MTHSMVLSHSFIPLFWLQILVYINTGWSTRLKDKKIISFNLLSHYLIMHITSNNKTLAANIYTNESMQQVMVILYRDINEKINVMPVYSTKANPLITSTLASSEKTSKCSNKYMRIHWKKKDALNFTKHKHHQKHTFLHKNKIFIYLYPQPCHKTVLKTINFNIV